MEIKKLIVKYKEISHQGATNIVTEEYKSWSQEGDYTLLYSDHSLDSLSLIIPTKSVISINVLRY